MNFRTFGEKVYFHIPKEKRQKWDVIAEKGIFVSYDENTKSFRIWLPERGQAKIRRNVRFINQHYEFNSNEECELNTIIFDHQKDDTTKINESESETVIQSENNKQVNLDEQMNTSIFEKQK